MKRFLAAPLMAVSIVILVCGIAVAATLTLAMHTGDTAAVTCQNGKLTKTAIASGNWKVYCKTTASATTTAPPPPPTTSTAPPPPPTTSTAPAGFSCVISANDACGPYDAPALLPMSNGYDTFVANQYIDMHGTETLYANAPNNWKVTANLSDCGGCVQSYPDVQQLTNDWSPKSDGTPAWGNSAGDANTPLAALHTLKINYAETSPSTGASYEFAPDIWQTNYPLDVMFWVDTKGRCNTGAFGDTVLGHVTLDGQPWTVHRYGNFGDEIIFVLDGPGGPGTCAQQSSGTINVKAGLEWLLANGFENGPIVLEQINSGWEITQSSGATFTLTNYSITAN